MRRSQKTVFDNRGAVEPVAQARCPRAPMSRQHRQGVAQVDHGVNAATEKVDRLHLQIPPK